MKDYYVLSWKQQQEITAFNQDILSIVLWRFLFLFFWKWKELDVNFNNNDAALTNSSSPAASSS